MLRKFLNKKILSMAKDIEKKDKEKELKKLSKRVSDREMINYFADKAREIIREAIDKKEKEFENEPTHVQVGDEVYVNLYNIKYDSSNGWDSGSSLIMNHFRDNGFPTDLPRVKVTDIYSTTCYIDEVINNWTEKQDYQDLEIWIDNETLVDVFFRYLETKDSYKNIMNDYGLYKNLKFEPINFEWGGGKYGLNIFSFIPVDSEEGRASVEIHKNKVDYLEHEKMVKELKDKEKELYEKYVDIRINKTQLFNI